MGFVGEYGLPHRAKAYDKSNQHGSGEHPANEDCRLPRVRRLSVFELAVPFQPPLVDTILPRRRSRLMSALRGCRCRHGLPPGAACIKMEFPDHSN